MLAISLWFVLYAMSVLSWEVLQYIEKTKNGEEKSSNLIVRILDEVPWTVLIIRNLIALALFFGHHSRIVHATEHLQQLLSRAGSGERPPKLQSFVRYSLKLFSVSVVIVLLNFIMVIMYLNRTDFSLYNTDWDFTPAPFSLKQWVVVLLMVGFTIVPFLMAQAVMATLAGLGKGAQMLLTNLNDKLKLLARDKIDHVGGTDGAAGENVVWIIDSVTGDTLPITDNIFLIRAVHFEACHFVEEVTEKFSKIFLTVLAGDFLAAVGFVGLLIGYVPAPDDEPLFDHLYHATATVVWMGFYLTAQYWPFVLIQEEVRVRMLLRLEAGVHVTEEHCMCQTLIE